MGRQWYYFEENGPKARGPISTDELKSKAASGEITPDTVLIEEGGRPCEASQLVGLFRGWGPWLKSSGGHIGTLVFGFISLGAGVGTLLAQDGLVAVFYFALAIGALIVFARQLMKRRRLE